MKKPPRRNIRIPREYRAKKPPQGQVKDFHPSRIAPERLEAFREAYIQTKGNAVRAARTIGMSPQNARVNAWRLVRALNIRVADALEMLGIDAVSQAKKLQFLREATMPKWNAGTEDWDIFLDSSTQLEATKEINRLRDEYPAKKEPAPAQGPVTVIFSTNIEQYKELRYASHEIGEPGGFQEQSPGDAGGRTPEGKLTRSRILDAEKSPGEGKR
jgi:hypothetical protein